MTDFKTIGGATPLFFIQTIMDYEQESMWIEWEYSSYTDEQIDNVLENATDYLDGHVRRMRFEKFKRQAAYDNFAK